MTAPHLAPVPALPHLPVTTVYGKPTGCFGCDKTKAKLADAGVPFEWVDVTQDMVALAAIRELGYQQVPVVVTTRPDGRDEHWSGLQPARIDAIIARYRAVVALKLANPDDTLVTALADTEGQALVQAILDRKLNH